MSVNEIVVCVLLAIGVLGFAVTSIGLLLSKDLYDQIHFLAPGTLIGAVAIPAAVIVHGGFSQAGVKAILIAILLFVSNPVLSHTIARAGRVRRKRQLAPAADEDIPFAKEQE
jgi:monovalent cation/proton antiporter MnhG/PhaG subunit